MNPHPRARAQRAKQMDTLTTVGYRRPGGGGGGGGPGGGGFGGGGFGGGGFGGGGGGAPEPANPFKEGNQAKALEALESRLGGK